jgi:malate synthase
MDGLPAGVELRGADVPGADRILTPAALSFVADLQRRFGPARLDLLHRRQERQRELDEGVRPDFPVATRRSARRRGRSRRPPPISTTGESRSPARPRPR